MTNLEGGKMQIATGEILATNGLIHRQVIENLEKVKVDSLDTEVEPILHHLAVTESLRAFP